MSRRHEGPKPIRRVKVSLTLDADAASLASVSEKLEGSRTSDGVLSVTLADTTDPSLAAQEARLAGDAVRAVFGKSQKEFK